jgi:hypothetical protein
MPLYLFSFFYSQQMAAHQGIACGVRGFPAAGGHRNGSVTFSAEGHVSPKGENPFCNTLNKSVGDKWRRKMATEQVPRSVALEQMSNDPWIMEAVNKGNCFVKVKGWHSGPQWVAFQSGGLALKIVLASNYDTFLLFTAFYHFTFLLFLPYVGSLFLHIALSSIFTVLFLIFFMLFIFSYFLPFLTLIIFPVFLFFFLLTFIHLLALVFLMLTLQSPFYIALCIATVKETLDRLRGLVVRVPGYRSRGPGSILGTTRFSEK